MSSTRVLVAALSLAWAGAVAAPLEVVVSSTGEVRLFDPAQPLSASNPLTVDSGLAPGAPFGVLQKGHLAAGQLSGLENSVLGYVKGGQLFTVGLTAGDDHVPKPVSQHTDLCGVFQDARSLRKPAKSWLLVGRAGADGVCFTGDDVATALRLETPPGQAGKSPAGLKNLLGNLAADGDIAGLLTIERNPQGAGPALVHRTAAFRSPALVMALSAQSTVGEALEHLELPAHFYFKLIPAGSSQPQLFRYDRAANGLQLVGPLHTFVATGTEDRGLARGAADPTHLYFQDGRTILRTPHTANGPGAVQTLASLDFGIYGMRTNGAMNRIVFDADVGVQSLLKTGGGLVSLATGGYNELVAVGGSDQVYLNVTGYTRPIPVTARQISADGSTVHDSSNAYFAGVVLPAAMDYSAGYADTPASIVKVALNGGSAVFSLRKAADGSARRMLGTLPGVLSLTAFCDQYGGDGFCAISDLMDHSRSLLACQGGAYCSLGALMDRGGGASDVDAHLFDSRAGASLAPMQVTPGVEDWVAN